MPAKDHRRARQVAAIAGALLAGSSSLSVRAQTTVDRDVNAYVEQLRGRKSAATFEAGHYRCGDIRIEVPAAWQYGGTLPGETVDDDTARWTDPATRITLNVWVSRRKVSPDAVSGLLATAVSSKAAQRAREGTRGWTVRPDSVQETTIGGHRALRAVADFEARRGGARVEYLTWIFTPESRVLVFATMSAQQLSAFQPEFDRVAQSISEP
jgi:hypothetical protein